MPDVMREVVALYQKWRQLDAEGDYSGAVGACDAMIDLCQGEGHAKSAELCREISFMKYQFWADCEAAFQAALTESARAAQPWIERATALMDLGRFNEATRSLETAVLLEPDSAEALWRLGVAKAEAGDGQLVEEALRCFNRALELDRDLEAAWYYRALALSDAHRDEEALASIEVLLDKLNPANHLAWQLRGVILENLRRLREAQDCYTRAAEITTAAGGVS